MSKVARTGRAIGSWLTGVICCCLLLVPLASCNTPQGPDTSLQPTPLDLGIPAESLKSPVTGPLAGDTKLHVRITFKIDPNLLNQSQQQTMQPGQSSHLEQFANKIGIDDAKYQKIKAFFHTQGIDINLSQLRTHLAIEAKASTLARLLQTDFVVHNYNGKSFYAPDTNKPAKVPQFLANSIDAITGLDNYSAVPKQDLHFNVQQPAQPAADCSPQDQTLLPKEIAHTYGFDQLWNRGLHGENMTINLVEIDGSYRDDIQNYFDCIQFKGKLTTVNVDGSPKEALGESTLDIQMVAGLARSSNIKVYQTDASDQNSDVWVNVNDELQQLLNDNVNNANSGNVVSISLGAAEGEMTTSDVKAIDSSLRQLSQVEHLAVFVASGDCGAFTSRRYGDLSVSFPASDPWSISVGGTILRIDQNANRVSEGAWSEQAGSQCQNNWGSGGGNSKLYQRSNWQKAPGVDNRYSQGRRQVPDVSAVAYGLAVYFQGQWGAVGGTSASAPIWATGLALVNQQLAQRSHKVSSTPDLFYKAATQNNGKHPYYDVTQGDNLYYKATSGWDYATGLGTLNLPDFADTVGKLT
ncbi:S53 family peptidase [Tengunoibacter tsumagoiensis]|uniref:Sedolisin n=1 Tax=Tengunoibacter tsumagoiensis TaxID=2014871 RepID=A0A401ZYF7_9CHLR|nr:S53 family peptidase [Tengunoibacter tsumagoiensis]GCE11894.1 sedolisin [Tengunoibacter tsumagoiensis]